MIFLTINNESTIFVMLTEADCNDMRGGRTKFVDQTVTQSHKFNKVVISLHKNQSEIEEVLTKSGHGALLKNMPSPVPQPQEAKCVGCEAIVSEETLLEGRCIVCWRDRSRHMNPRRHEDD